MTPDTNKQLAEQVASAKRMRAELKDIETRILRELPSGRAASIARTHAETAGMYLGKVLQEIGEAHPELVLRNPYPTSRDPGTPGIDPTAPEIRNPDHYSPRPG